MSALQTSYTTSSSSTEEIPPKELGSALGGLIELICSYTSSQYNVVK